MIKKTLLFIFFLNIYAHDSRPNHWMRTEFIWNFSLISSCNKGVTLSPIDHFKNESKFNHLLYSNIKRGDIVWIKTIHIDQFSKQILPFVEHPFVVVISDGDESFPCDYQGETAIDDFVNHPFVYHIFTQNCSDPKFSSKISQIPIGIDYHTIAYKSSEGGWGEKGSPLDQEKSLKEIISTLKPTSTRRLRAFVDFQHNDTMHAGHHRYLLHGEDRKSIFKQLLTTNLIDQSIFLRRSELWKKKGEYAFSISPHGNGLDCHRTWEDLLLGCIVIVKRSSLDTLYEGLPVIIIDSWSEVTHENLTFWLKKFHDASTNPKYRERLTHQYWFNKIKTKADELL